MRKLLFITIVVLFLSGCSNKPIDEVGKSEQPIGVVSTPVEELNAPIEEVNTLLVLQGTHPTAIAKPGVTVANYIKSKKFVLEQRSKTNPSKEGYATVSFKKMVTFNEAAQVLEAEGVWPIAIKREGGDGSGETSFSKERKEDARQRWNELIKSIEPIISGVTIKGKLQDLKKLETVENVRLIDVPSEGILEELEQKGFSEIDLSIYAIKPNLTDDYAFTQLKK